jgi:hypothetical protein
VFHADRQTDGQTDMTDLVVAFRNFGNVPNKTAYSQRISTAVQINLCKRGAKKPAGVCDVK